MFATFLYTASQLLKISLGEEGYRVKEIIDQIIGTKTDPSLGELCGT